MALYIVSPSVSGATAPASRGQANWRTRDDRDRLGREQRPSCRTHWGRSQAPNSTIYPLFANQSLEDSEKQIQIRLKILLRKLPKLRSLRNLTNPKILPAVLVLPPRITDLQIGYT